MLPTPVHPQRASPRYEAHFAVTVQPVTNNLEPTEEPIEAVSVDLSQGGLCFYSKRPLLSDLTIVRIGGAEGKQVELLSRRVRCRRIGPQFEVAVSFVRKLEQPRTAAQ